MRVGGGRGGTTAVPPAASARASRDRAFRERYLGAYRGDADPFDALWWLEHPEEPSPAGTPSPWALLRERRRRLYAADATAEELEAVLALERSAEAVRDAAAEALRGASGEGSEPPVPARPVAVATGRSGRRPWRPLTALGAAVLVAVVVVAALAALPEQHVDRPELARSLQAVFPGATPRPGDVRLALSGLGSETLSRSVVGTAELRITTILCRGEGRIQVRLSDRDEDGMGMRCAGGNARLTRMLDEMPRDPFLATVTVSGPVSWSVTVTDEDARVDEESFPRCIGAAC